MKYCADCGAPVPERGDHGDRTRKYCASCALRRTRAKKAEWMQEFRAHQREKNRQTRKLCRVQAEEIAALRRLVQKQRDKVAALKAELEKSESE